jgi:predicted GH43/DUF377 family glycosyl hydrolase
MKGRIPCGHCRKPACLFCWKFDHNPAYRKHWGGEGNAVIVASPAPKSRGACSELGDALPGQEKIACTAKLRRCNLLDVVCSTSERRPEAAACCAYCDFHTDLPVSLPDPVRTSNLRFDQTTLWPGVPGLRFNASIIADGDGYVIAARNGWRGSEIYAGRLDRQFRPAGEPVKLYLRHHWFANYGREDPRLFQFGGALHIAFIGVVGGRMIRHTNQMFARLSPGLQVEDIFHPRYAGRNLWEKNWQFFESGQQLYAVYSFAPHKILRIEGNWAEVAYETPTPARWNPGTEVRGGASPVLVGDEFWCFFHSRSERPRRYMAGVYTFQAEPPFRVRRITPDPILTADGATKPGDQYCPVVFPCGAVLVRDVAGAGAGEG